MTYPEEHNYQSADEGYESDGPEPLTAEEIEYIDSKIEECKDSLAGVVTVSISINIFSENLFLSKNLFNHILNCINYNYFLSIGISN